MHDYMRAIGFSEEFNREDFKALLSEAVYTADVSRVLAVKDGFLQMEYRKYFGTHTGLIIRGTMEANKSGQEEIYIDYTIPFLKATAISSTGKIDFEKYANREEYAGICEDYRLGMPLIFELQNMNDYLQRKEELEESVIDVLHLSLAALSLSGAVMIPIEKSESDELNLKKKRQKRETLLRQARIGDEAALENMTLEDMDTYSLLQRRARSEDVYSLVDTYFMPSGIEGDRYSVLGEIKDVTESVNSFTGEELYILDIVANEVFFNVCIHKGDLFGEPEIGRRFKGIVWMQGNVNF